MKKTVKNKYWFKRKTFGWGWTPCTWQGWLILAIWFIFFILSMNVFDHEWIKNVVVVGILTLILIIICYKKGEKPRWQWGKK